LMKNIGTSPFPPYTRGLGPRAPHLRTAG